jgi:hypothetical protein
MGRGWMNGWIGWMDSYIVHIAPVHKKFFDENIRLQGLFSNEKVT